MGSVGPNNTQFLFGGDGRHSNSNSNSNDAHPTAATAFMRGASLLGESAFGRPQSPSYSYPPHAEHSGMVGEGATDRTAHVYGGDPDDADGYTYHHDGSNAYGDAHGQGWAPFDGSALLDAFDAAAALEDFGEVAASEGPPQPAPAASASASVAGADAHNVNTNSALSMRDHFRQRQERMRREHDEQQRLAAAFAAAIADERPDSLDAFL